MPSTDADDASTTRSNRELFTLAVRALGVQGVDVAKLLRVHPRTVSRWLHGRAYTASIWLGKLAPHVHAKDPALAESLHRRALRDADPAPLPVPPLPAPPAPPPDLPLRVRDVVHAVCDAMDASPRAARPGLLAAVRAMRQHELSLDDLERELSAAAAEEERSPPSSTGGRRGGGSRAARGPGRPPSAR